jgi:hypothetical protein
MEKTAYDAYKYSFISVSVFGILSNILVLISIFRQRSLLKNNYYFLVSQLAINDLGGPVNSNKTGTITQVNMPILA